MRLNDHMNLIITFVFLHKRVANWQCLKIEKISILLCGSIYNYSVQFVLRAFSLEKDIRRLTNTVYNTYIYNIVFPLDISFPNKIQSVPLEFYHINQVILLIHPLKPPHTQFYHQLRG